MSEIKAKEIVNLTEFAKLVGYTEPTIRSWVKLHGMPVLHDEFSQGVPWRICVPEALAWLEKFEERKKRTRGLAQQGMSNTDDNLERSEQMAFQRLRKAKADADSKEFDLAVKQGRFILIEDVVREVSNQLSAVNDGLSALSGNAASLLMQASSSEEIQEVLLNCTNDIRSALSTAEVVINLTGCEPEDAVALIEQETSHDSDNLATTEDKAE